MPQPTAYTRKYNFADYQTSNPSDPVPADRLEAEFNAVKQTTDETLANLALIQRDDGKLKNSTVHADSLSAAVRALTLTEMNPRGNWATSTSYAVKDVVERGSTGYICMAAHTSGVFDDDHAAGRWLSLGTAEADVTSYRVVATGSDTARSLAEWAAMVRVQIESVAALRAAEDLDHPVIYLQGHTTEADGGEGYFYLVSGSYTEEDDDGGTFLVAANGNGYRRNMPDGIYTPQMFGARADGVTDDSASIAAMLDAMPEGAAAQFPHATYVAAIEIKKPCQINFMGSTIRPPSTATTYIIYMAGEASATTYELTGNVSRGTVDLEVTDTVTDIAAGDLILLQDNTARPSDGALVNREVHRVGGVSGTTITLADHVRMPKTATAGNIRKITPITGVSLSNLKLEALDGTVTNIGVYVSYGSGTKVRDIEMSNSAGPCVTFRYSYDCELDGFNFHDPQSVGNGQGYGAQLYGGSASCTIRNGRIKGFGNGVDLGGSIDAHVADVLVIGSLSTAFAMSHNSFDADMLFERCVSHSGANGTYGFAFADQGVTDPHSIRAYGVRIRDSAVHINGDLGTGVYMRVPTVDGDIHVDVLFRDGSVPTAGTATSGVRFLPVNSARTRVRAKVRGAHVGAFYYAGTSVTETGNPDGVEWDLEVENVNYGLFTQFASVSNIKRLHAKNVQTTVLHYNYAPAGQSLRRLNISDMTVEGFVPGRLIRWDTDAPHGVGIHGRIGTITTDTADDSFYTVEDTDTITLEMMLAQRAEPMVILTAASPVTLGDPCLDDGLVEGQTITIVNAGSNDITLPHSATKVVNNGATSVVLGAAKRSVTYIWGTDRWRQVS